METPDICEEVGVDIDNVKERKNTQFFFTDQFFALLKKSVINQKRQYKTNLCQILLPLVLLLLLFILQILVNNFVRNEYGDYTTAVTSPSVLPNFFSISTNLSDISLCTNSEPQVDRNDGRIVYSTYNQSGLGTPPNFLSFPPSHGSGLLDNFITSPLLTLEGQVFPSEGLTVHYCDSHPYLMYPTFIQLPDKASVDKLLFNSWAKFSANIMGGFDFAQMEIVGKIFNFGVFYNYTLSGGSDVPLFVNMISQAVWKQIAKNPMGNLVWAGYINFPTPSTIISIDLVSLIGNSLYIYIFQLFFPIFLSGIVYEKENNLREIMKMMGLKMWVYWLVSYLFNLMMYLVTTLLIVLLGAAFGFRFFTANSGGILFVFFFLWGNTMISFAFFLSVFFTKTRTAIICGYIILILTGIISDNVINSIVADPATPASVLRGISVIPQFAFFRGLREFRNAVVYGGPGMTWGDAGVYGMSEVLAFFVVEWFVFGVLAVYLEAVVPIGPGVKSHPLFFLPKSLRKNKEIISPEKGQEPEDVAAERARTEAASCEDPIRVLDLHKLYPPSGGRAPKVAVNNLSMAIQESECFGFLGPNGAGKSTTINMLCGYLRPSSGTTMVHGLDIVHHVDEIHLQMGVCPQDNVLWDDLTGPEHLEFYGRIKNLQGKALENQVRYWLDQVNLTKAKNKTSCQYSGGMKRRLCVAMAMIGNPAVVLLDEPTTGLDPGSRQDLWKVILNYKKHCSMLLTTHSMEEAERLCDRLGIFVGGKLAAVGTSEDLKSRFGQGYRLVMTTPPEYEQQTRDYVSNIIPQATLLNSLSGTQQWEVPKEAIKLSKVFKTIENDATTAHILDWGISNTTLEEVFLHIMENLDKNSKQKESLSSQ